MKLLTLNTHSLIEDNYESKLHIFTDTVYSEKPDIIALQEVNQTLNAKKAISPENFIQAGIIPLKCDNHALKAAGILNECGLRYNLAWAGIKCGYGQFDEGLAILSLKPLTEVKSILLSKTDDYDCWKTRKALFAKTEDACFYCLHMGWWNDEDEPFLTQWQRLRKQFGNEPTFLMGDFNSPSSESGGGYSLVTSSGWLDTYTLAKEKDDGFTVSGNPDGWAKDTRERIDYIFTNRMINVRKYQTMFREDRVSDHFGVMVTL